MKNYLRGWSAVLGLLTFLLVGCAPAVTPTPKITLSPPVPPISMALPTTVTTPPPSPVAPPLKAVPKATPKPAPATSMAPASCHVVANKADRRCTPGALNPMVTDATLKQTVCKPGYTTSIRPPVSYTGPLKLRQMKAYGEAPPSGQYQEDHLIALELGGAPRDPANLWPEPYFGAQNANQKDAQENQLHAALCAGRLTLAGAQQTMVNAWTHP